jgi:hypothetical protein
VIIAKIVADLSPTVSVICGGVTVSVGMQAAGSYGLSHAARNSERKSVLIPSSLANMVALPARGYRDGTELALLASVA